MKCVKCTGERILEVTGKTSDLNYIRFPHLEIEKEGYVPEDLNIGSGDYLELDVCMDCGTLQGEWPLSDVQVTAAMEES